MSEPVNIEFSISELTLLRIDLEHINKWARWPRTLQRAGIARKISCVLEKATYRERRPSVTVRTRYPIPTPDESLYAAIAEEETRG